MEDLHHFYSTRKNEFALQCEKYKSIIRRVAIVRLTVALFVFAVAYFGFSNPVYWYGLLPLVAGFVYLVAWHSKTRQQLELSESLATLNDLEIKVLTNDYASFYDGREFVNPHHPFSYDLDLFGPGSIFQYLNRCGTAIGEGWLANNLSSVRLPLPEIPDRQEAVKELASMVDFRQWFWAQGHLLKDNTTENEGLFNWLNEKDHVLGNVGTTISLIVFPAISILMIGLTIYNFATYFPLLLLSGMVQWIIISFKSKEITKAESALSHHKKLFDKYSQLLSKLADAQFGSPKLKFIQDEAREAARHIKKFSQLVNAFEARKNGIAAMFGNSLYLYDLQCLYRLEKWRALNKDKVRGWFDKIAEIDCLNSFSTFHFNNPNNSFPVLHEDLAVNATELGHPLILPEERINNSFNLGDPANVMLITGANMAGKSTFLRTMGVNFVLAMAGSSVCAKRFSCPIVDLHTSMRATDSLVDHQSYFYAELNRLKDIMGFIRSGRPAIVLLDEILRGTNSKDKQEGSIGLLKQFVASRALVMLASHDVALGELEQKFPASIRNYCFESGIEKDTLTFDYTLHAGVANKANATFLMKKMGILPENPSS